MWLLESCLVLGTRRVEAVEGRGGGAMEGGLRRGGEVARWGGLEGGGRGGGGIMLECEGPLVVGGLILGSGGGGISAESGGVGAAIDGAVGWSGAIMVGGAGMVPLLRFSSISESCESMLFLSCPPCCAIGTIFGRESLLACRVSSV